MSVAGSTEEALIRAVEDLRHSLEAIESVVLKLARGEQPDSVPEMRTFQDSPWVCVSCGSKLGVYDQAADVLRTRYKDFYQQIHLGPGGWISTPCRSCGYVNRAADTTEPTAG